MTLRLNKKETEILHFLNRMDAGLEALNGNLTKEAIAIKLNINTNVDGLIERLLKNDLIEEITSINGNNKCFRITPQGENYLEFLITDKKEKLKWSVYFPIIVTLVTNLIIEIIKNLL